MSVAVLQYCTYVVLLLQESLSWMIVSQAGNFQKIMYTLKDFLTMWDSSKQRTQHCMVQCSTVVKQDDSRVSNNDLQLHTFTRPPIHKVILFLACLEYELVVLEQKSNVSSWKHGKVGKVFYKAAVTKIQWKFTNNNSIMRSAKWAFQPCTHSLSRVHSVPRSGAEVLKGWRFSSSVISGLIWRVIWIIF